MARSILSRLRKLLSLEKQPPRDVLSPSTSQSTSVEDLEAGPLKTGVPAELKNSYQNFVQEIYPDRDLEKDPVPIEALDHIEIVDGSLTVDMIVHDELVRQARGISRHEAQLQGFLHAGIEKVFVLSQRDDETCSACFEHDGAEYTVRDALRRKPLPHKQCQNDECRCDYMPAG